MSGAPSPSSTRSSVRHRERFGRCGRNPTRRSAAPDRRAYRQPPWQLARKAPNVMLTVSEMNDRDLIAALEERRLDVALDVEQRHLAPCHELAALSGSAVGGAPGWASLAGRPTVDWDALRDEVILVQGWDESRSARELYAAFLGHGARFRSHPASKQSVFALVGAGFGITLATAGQSEVAFPGVVFKPIDDPDASIQMVLAWLPELEDATVGRFVAFCATRRGYDNLCEVGDHPPQLNEVVADHHEPGREPAIRFAPGYSALIWSQGRASGEETKGFQRISSGHRRGANWRYFL